MKIGTISIVLASFFILTVWAIGHNPESLEEALVDDDVEKIASSNNELGLEVLREVSGDGNTLISPVSLFMALSMVYNGSDGATKEEMGKVLHSAGIDAADLSKANASLMSLLQQDSKKIQLHIANSIWLNQDFHFQSDFAKNNKKHFHAEIQEIDIKNSKSVKKINDWVEESTKGKIEDIVESPLDPDLAAILINAVYFKGNWKDAFDEKKTVKRTFQLANGTSKMVPLMALNKKLPYMENEEFQAVSLPYGDGKWSMNVFLPKENSNLEEFQNRLTPENWEQWRTEFTLKEGTVLLPKFKLEYEVLLNEALKRLGMPTAFDGQHANFSKMIMEPDQVWISKVKQKTYIEVNEKGTEAAAATSVEMKTEMAITDPPFFMEVNRPFFFAIMEEKTGTIAFMGLISDPSKAS
ncbi:serpin family protein [Neobacillus muris]|uniref:serpin family protein n=1 Tax=Neobacillus muris TaxID=2941334 RepID=UPI00203E034C|nr:serpin family protein [Neobacillus muris]